MSLGCIHNQRATWNAQLARESKSNKYWWCWFNFKTTSEYIQDEMVIKAIRHYILFCRWHSGTKRPRKRITELLLKAMGNNDQNKLKEGKQWQLLFNRTPLEICENPTTLSVSGIQVQINQLTGEDFENPTIEDSGAREMIPCGIVFKSIGYKSLPLAEELPFDYAKGVIMQTEGRVDGLPGTSVSESLPRS